MKLSNEEELMEMRRIEHNLTVKEKEMKIKLLDPQLEKEIKINANLDQNVPDLRMNGDYTTNIFMH